MKGNKICATCHSEYDFCPKCKKDKNKPLWYFSFCSQNCHNIYETTSNFENGKIEADEAKLQLESLDLSKLDDFGESYKKSINKIMSSASIKEDVSEEEKDGINVDEQVIEKENSNDVTEEVIEENVLKKSKNKRTKIDVEE